MEFEFTTSFNYVLAWCVYLISSLGFILVFWQMTRWITIKGIRRFLRASLAVVLLTPFVVAQENHWMAPAFLVALYEYGLGNVEVSQQAALYMLVGVVIILLGLKLEFILRKIWKLQEES